MCGRYRLSRRKQIVEEYFASVSDEQDWAPGYNIAPTQPAPPAAVSFSGLKPGSYRLKLYRTGFRANDAYSAYVDMGAPKDLTPSQLEELQSLTRDLPQVDRVIRIRESGSHNFSLPMHSNDVVLVTLERTK